MSELNRTSLLLGWLMGRQIVGLREAQGQVPVAYLYEGVRLPPLPERVTKSDPHMVILQSDGKYYAYGLPGANMANTDGSMTIFGIVAYGNGVVLIDGAWADIDYGVLATKIVWSGYNITDENGTLHCAASTPIPVYE